MVDETVRLSQLARFLFERSATDWYRALALEVLVSVVSASIALVGAGEWALRGTLLVVVLFVAAYVMRLVAEDTHDTAQTMRRQAALGEGLGWPVDRIQAEDWRRKAGLKLIRRVDAEPRAADYYATVEPAGPRRMAAMTLESAFYTRHLYLTIRWALGLGLLLIALVVLVILYLALTEAQAAAFGTAVAHVVATVVLVAIALDVVGWLLRLTRQAEALREVEAGLDRLVDRSDVSETDVLRLVAEYDCQLADSIPIHPRIFRHQHDEIRELWERRGGGGAD